MIKETANKLQTKKAYSENELAKIGVSPNELFNWRVEVMVEFSRLKMDSYDFRQSIIAEKDYADCLLMWIINAEYSMVMNTNIDDIDYKTYERYVLTMLGKANTSFVITESIVQIITNRKLREKHGRFKTNS